MVLSAAVKIGCILRSEKCDIISREIKSRRPGCQKNELVCEKKYVFHLDEEGTGWLNLLVEGLDFLRRYFSSDFSEEM